MPDGEYLRYDDGPERFPITGHLGDGNLPKFAPMGVTPYLHLPLWVPSKLVGFARVDCRKAIAAGLRFRPLTQTIQDTLDWDATRPANYA